jgi:hypothetical protein
LWVFPFDKKETAKANLFNEQDKKPKNLKENNLKTLLAVLFICWFVDFTPDIYSQTKTGDYMETTPGFNLLVYKERLDFVTNHQTRSHYSECNRCGIQWRYVNGHGVAYSKGRGLFALCEHCWNECNKEQRIFYYSELWKAHYELYHAMEGSGYNDKTQLDTLINNIKLETKQGANLR